MLHWLVILHQTPLNNISFCHQTDDLQLHRLDWIEFVPVFNPVFCPVTSVLFIRHHLISHHRFPLPFYTLEYMAINTTNTYTMFSQEYYLGYKLIQLIPSWWRYIFRFLIKQNSYSWLVTTFNRLFWYCSIETPLHSSESIIKASKTL